LMQEKEQKSSKEPVILELGLNSIQYL